VTGWDGDRRVTLFLPNPSCKYLDTGVNYHDLCKNGQVGQVRIGSDVLIESFEILDKCRGVVDPDLVQSTAVFAVVYKATRCF
jgi:hypothetical protein